MDHLIYVLAVCISAPLLLMMAVADSKTRRLLGFMILGISLLVLASEINTLLREALGAYLDDFHLTTSVTPLCEELLKAMPLLFVALFLTDDRSVLFSQAMAIGVGFAVMENTYILLQNLETVTLFWALIRGFASGLMHALCTLFIGIGISMVRKRRKLFFCGTFALLVAAAIYHSMFNMLIQSSYMYIGAMIPIATYCALVWADRRRKWLRKKS